KPRAYFAYQQMIAPTEDSLKKTMMQDDFDGSKALFNKDDTPPILHSDSGKNAIHFDNIQNEEIVMTAETDKKGFLILTDTYYPGWKCYVNDIEVPIYRANYCMRAVLLDSGKSKVVF